MNDLRSLILEAGTAALEVENAKAGVEAARQQVEVARGVLDEAKTAYDAALEACEAGGMTKAKAKKAVEQLNQIFVEAGVIEADAPAAAQDKPQRRKRKGKTDETSTEVAGNETTQAAEPTPPETEAAEEAPVEDVPVSAVPAETEFADIAPAASTENDVDDSADEIRVAFSEYIDPDHELATMAGYVLDATLEGAALAFGANLDFETFSEILSIDGIRSLANNGSVGTNLSATLAEIADADKYAPIIVEWLAAVMKHIEDGGEAPGMPVVKSAAEETADIAQPAAEDDLEAEVSDIDDVANNDDVDVSDDDSFPIDGDTSGNGEIVDDIGEINFLDGDEASGGGLTEAAVEEPKTEEKPKPVRGAFAPPAFMKR